MEHSETMGALFGALAKAQGAISAVAKDTENPFYKSRYADLASVWAVCRQPLSAAGIAIIQAPTYDGEWVSIETIMSHESGEWLSTILTSRPTKQDVQGVGSVITYLRRYSLMALVGCAPEDDDGNNAVGNSSKPIHENKAPVLQSQDTDEKIFKTCGILEEVKIAHSKENDTKKWTKYGLVVSKKSYGTFDSKIGAEAQKHVGGEVVLEYEADGKFFKCLSFTPGPSPKASPEMPWDNEQQQSRKCPNKTDDAGNLVVVFDDYCLSDCKNKAGCPAWD